MPSSEQKVRLSRIRGAEGGDLTVAEEALPAMPRPCEGFHSTAHLRSDEYWKDLLGQEDKALGPCAWVEGRTFQGFVACTIVAYTLLFGAHGSGPSAPPWEWLTCNLILALSFFELLVVLVRLRAGVRFAGKEELAVRALDAAIVLGCLLLQWGLPLASALHVEPWSNANIFARVLWLVRFVRLVQIVPALNELAHGIFDALQGLFWVLVFVLLLLYALAIVCTRLIGHAELDILGYSVEEESPEAQEVRALFSSVCKSMFILFQVMSAWSLKPLIPLFELVPATRIGFSLFYIYAGWTLLAVMTGTVSFTMIALKSKIMSEDLLREEERRQHVGEVLQDIFERLDEDGNGELTSEELQFMLKSREVQQLLETHTNIAVQDLENVFSWLDHDQSGTISWDEFMYGFKWLNDPFKPKTLLRLREKLTKDIKDLMLRMEGCFSSSVDKVVAEVEPPIRKIYAMSEQVQMLHALSTDLRRGIEAPCSLAEMEDRLGSRIDLALERVERFVAVEKPATNNFASELSRRTAHSTVSGGTGSRFSSFFRPPRG